MTAVADSGWFDPLGAPLDGVSLVEASAGTGKTHAITELYLRLVLEAGLPVESILVITYTRAATAELRTRIRARLAAADKALRAAADQDPALLELVGRAGGAPRAMALLDAALQTLDQAAVHTTHGFCQRALAEHAFESGVAFDRELLPDQATLLNEVVADFWRREFHAAPPVRVEAAYARGLTPAKLGAWIAPRLTQLGLWIVAPPDAAAGLAGDEANYAVAWAAAAEIWARDGAAIATLLRDSAALNRNRYRVASVAQWLEVLASGLAGATPRYAVFVVFEKLDRLTPAGLAAGTKQGATPPRHRFFDACAELLAARDALTAAYQRWDQGLRARLLEFARAELSRRRRAHGLMAYDDLLLDLDAALARPGGQLAQALRGRYRAALIDEFQDTDTVQLSILRRLYAGSGRPLFLIGDPKQAIYRFRGADVFAYLAGAREAERRYGLGTNWRSTPGLITAVNALFSGVAEPFGLREIGFTAARPAERTAGAGLEPAEDDPADLRIWFMERESGGGKPIGKGDAAAVAVRSTAGEIAMLVERGAAGEARLEGRALGPGDIAVLVRSHHQGRLMRQALLELQVPCVRYGQDDVWATPEAEQIERVLRAVAEPGREGLLRAALVTPLLGCDGRDIYALDEDERAWEKWAARVRDWHLIWRERGVLRFFGALIREAEVAPRLLRRPDGERRLTNLRHLAELIHEAEATRGLGVERLLAWLAWRRGARAENPEQAQLRLESDGASVRVLTIHASKGLEFPIVFCPFLWDAGPGTSGDILYHDPSRGDRASLWLNGTPPPEIEIRARREALAEALRLLYVAVTRARERCYVVWGGVNKAGETGLAWLLHGGAVDGATDSATDSTDPVGELAAHFASLDDGDLREALDALRTRAAGAIAIASPPAPRTRPVALADGERTRLAARRFRGAIAEGWRITSYTALVAGLPAELPDHDAEARAPEAEAAVAQGGGRFAFPRGARAGSCLHAILERVDFGTAGESLQAVAAETLAMHGFASVWAAEVAAWLGEVVATPLTADSDAVRLADIGSGARLSELEFHYPVARLDPHAITAVLSDHGMHDTGVERLSGGSRHGYVTGFIDLVFASGGRYYLADYKSNWLGGRPGDYDAARLATAMRREAYGVQALLYSVALHRYLALRVPDYAYAHHFGGAYYLFLRGMSRRSGARRGVHFLRPSEALITALDKTLGGGPPEGGEPC